MRTSAVKYVDSGGGFHSTQPDLDTWMLRYDEHRGRYTRAGRPIPPPLLTRIGKLRSKHVAGRRNHLKRRFAKHY